ncbi:MAG: DnaB-like helicase C-terminal domain-containing protein [Candidatus Cohnella colombiensis]|uniref:DNA 5'-3' helicase n=1 Tax=Candidatus Cohnella colombiensis TaxID=3121368 RepID=A0AA95JAT9_9BACL|nr:MAG: DnaB-like helicase C-terminal domain-containing protein [Cohnella sp.]
MTQQDPITHGLQAEQAVLGAIFLDSSSIDRIPDLEPRDFSESHALIFQVMRWLNKNDMPIDIITVTNQFVKFKREIDVAYLMQLSDSSPSAENIKYYASIVRSKALRRRGEKVGNEIVALSRQDFDSDEDYFAAIEDKVDELRPKESSKMQSFRDMRTEYFEKKKSKAEKLKTGLFKKFDEWAQLWRGWLYVLAGRPGVGKTAKALQLLYGIASHNLNAGPVLFWSQEMDKTEVIDRMVSMIAEVNYDKLINNGGTEGFTDAQWDRINEAYRICENLLIFVQDSSGVSIDEIRATVKQFKKQYGKVAAVIVDYLQIMEIPEKKGETRAQAIGRITKASKNIARRFKLVFIMLSQLDRAVDKEEPKLSHLKESGSIEQDSDVVEFLWYNPDDQLPDSSKIIDSIFAKGRNIGLNRFRLEFKWWHQKFVETDLKVGAKDDGDSNKANRNTRGVRSGAGATKKRSSSN